MYEKEIEFLKVGGYLSPDNPIAQTAIALMRAAQPKDAAAEREHCERFANEWLRGGDGPNLAESVERERAAARAEVAGERHSANLYRAQLDQAEAELAQIKALLAPRDVQANARAAVYSALDHEHVWTQAEALVALITQAHAAGVLAGRAEMDRQLQQATERAGDLSDALAAAERTIARLRGDLRRYGRDDIADQRDALQTRLDNLIEAVQYARGRLEAGYPAGDLLLKAIDAAGKAVKS